MNIGIYARKSIYTDNSDSIDVQISLCKEYASKFNPETITIYKDEGYTGANTQRPDFIRLMNDVNVGRLDMLICYKIDRISRNVLDFSKTFAALQEKQVEFVSVKEQIDTSTPLGRAMMYICSVFAQMERETIAERIKDNMIELAKAGKWAGGKPPLGYKSKKVVMNGKKHSMLVTDETTVPFLFEIFDTFLSGYSLNGLETYFRKKGTKTIKGKYLSSSQLHQILKNPHYVANDPQIYDYFESLGCIMADDRNKYDGKHGLIVYGRTSGSRKKKHIVNTPDKWVVAVGMHAPLIPSKKWLKVQEKFGQNLIDKTSKYEIGLLKGILKCKCGYKMRVKHKVDKIYHKIYDSYYCQQRNSKGSEYCDMKMVSVSKIDAALLNILQSIQADKSLLYKYYAEKQPQTIIRKKEEIFKDISVAKKKISNLMQILQDNNDSAAAKYIIHEIENLDKSIIGYNYELREVDLIEKENEEKNINIDAIYNRICDYLLQFDTLDYNKKTNFLKKIIKKCIWDGQNLFLEF